MEAAGEKSKFSALTGLRIFAATGVFLSHLAVPASVPGPAQTFMSSGYSGVTLFFTLSGFVLAWTYGDRFSPKVSRHAVWSFGVARFARIYPLYLLALLFSASSSLVHGHVDSALWGHLLAVQAWSPDMNYAYALNGPGWTIGVEFFLYACFPLLIVVFSRMRLSPRLLVAIGAICALGLLLLTLWFWLAGRNLLPWADPDSAHRWLYRTPVTRLGDFVIGIIAALLIRKTHPPLAWALAAQVIGVVSFLGLMAWSPMLFSVWSWDVAYLVPTFLIIWGLARGSETALARFLGSKPMVFAGEVSFAFYLLHAPLLHLLHYVHILESESFPQWLLLAFAKFVFIFVIAVGAHWFLERPAQRWLRRVLDRRPANAIPERTEEAGVLR